jgi:hypothetical protein
MTDSESQAEPIVPLVLKEVKYSLPQMLQELKAERATSTYAMERLDQHEIGKLFKSKTPRRRAKSK